MCCQGLVSQPYVTENVSVLLITKPSHKNKTSSRVEMKSISGQTDRCFQIRKCLLHALGGKQTAEEIGKSNFRESGVEGVGGWKKI
jgi:hypothetical protein